MAPGQAAGCFEIEQREVATMASNATTVSRAQALVAGTQQQFANKSVTFAGATYTSAQLVTLLLSFIALYTDVSTAQQQYKAKLLAQRDQAPPLAATIALYKAFVLATFAKQPDVLATFGLTSRKTPATPKVEEKFEAVLHRAATRKARNTLGKKAKLKITGTAPQIEVSEASAEPVATSAAPTVTVTTAPAGSGGGHAQ
jgi:hypothetical protein